MKREIFKKKSLEEIQEDIKKSIAEFDQNELDEATLKRAFSTLGNSNFDDIYIKVVLLNNLYSTRLNDHAASSNNGKEKKNIDIRFMANLIHEYNTDRKKIDDCKTSEQIYELIDDFCVSVPSQYKIPLSFLTKYFSWTYLVKENYFDVPLVDRYVRGMIYYLSKNVNIKINKLIRQIDLCSNYEIFRKAYFAVKKEVDLSNHSCKDFDKYLWTYGKKNSIWL